MLAEIMQNIKRQRPLVHCIANYVTANDCANLLLAVGASPMMADAPEEMAEVDALCDGHVLNLGTPSTARIEAMRLAGRSANASGKPLLLDPVGAGSTSFRKNAALALLDELQFSIIRGNAGEIQALESGKMDLGGVDANAKISCLSARRLSQRKRAVVIMSGERDVVTDGRCIYRVFNGDAMMRRVTGTGCMLSALAGVCLAANPAKPLEAALAATCMMGICGEHAQRRMERQGGNASYRNYLIDAIDLLTPEELEVEARYELE